MILLDLDPSDYVKEWHKLHFITLTTKPYSGKQIYKNVSPNRILTAEWVNFKDNFYVSDFGGIIKFETPKVRKVIRPIAQTRRGKHYLTFKPNSVTVHYIATLVFKHFVLPKNKIEDYSGASSLVNLFDYANDDGLDCRKENLIPNVNFYKNVY